MLKRVNIKVGEFIVIPGSVVVPPGSVVVPPGSVVVPPGSVVVTTGSVVVPPGSVVVTTGSVVVPPGSVVVPPGSVVVTTGSVVVTTGSVVFCPRPETRAQMGEKALASDQIQFINYKKSHEFLPPPYDSLSLAFRLKEPREESKHHSSKYVSVSPERLETTRKNIKVIDDLMVYDDDDQCNLNPCLDKNPKLITLENLNLFQNPKLGLSSLNLANGYPNLQYFLEYLKYDVYREQTVEFIDSQEIDRKINESVKEVVISSVKHAMRAPFRARFKDLPTYDMKEILLQRMLEENYDKGHTDHRVAYEALQDSISRDECEDFDVDKSHEETKKKSKPDSPKTPPGSPPSPPPPPPPLSGASGASGTTGASDSAQAPPPPPSSSSSH
ncbi:hypothetical protein Tco_0666615 [Tanacetum coccineum]